MPAPTEGQRRVAIGLALAAGFALVMAALGHAWLEGKLIETRFGLLSVDQPRFGDLMDEHFARRVALEPGCGSRVETCTISNGRYLELANAVIDDFEVARKADPEHMAMVPIPRRPVGAFSGFGLAALVSCLVAAAGLLAAAGMALGRARPTLPIMPTTIALLGLIAALVTGCVFVALKPDGNGLLGVGWSFFAYGGGVICGLAGATLINRHIKPFDPDLAAASLAWQGGLDSRAG